MLKEQIFSNWHPMRWVILVVSLILGYNYMVHGAAVSGVLSLFLLFQSVTNTGCLLGQCTPRMNMKTDDHSTEDVTFEEITTK